MSYEYDENNGLQPKPPKKNNNDLGSWIFIAVMFAVAWPVGLILLLSKLSEGGGRKMRQQARDADIPDDPRRRAAGAAQQGIEARRYRHAGGADHEAAEGGQHHGAGQKDEHRGFLVCLGSSAVHGGLLRKVIIVYYSAKANFAQAGREMFCRYRTFCPLTFGNFGDMIPVLEENTARRLFYGR